MADYGVTNEGFKRKTYDVILSDMKEQATNLFGENINLTSKSPFGLFLQLFAYILSIVWMVQEKLYNSFYINTATGQSLDNLVKYLGISRKSANKATGIVTFAGDEGTPIDPNTIVETGGENTVRFLTTNTSTLIIDNTGTIDVEITAELAGLEGNVTSGSIDVITNPIPGLDSVTNSSSTTGGSNRETDLELRNRYVDSTDLAGGATSNSIRANVLQNTSATACLIIENDTNDFDSNLIPPKSFETIVLAPIGSEVDQSIGEAIFDKKAAGINAYGDIDITIIDDAGLDKVVSFSRATEVQIYVDVSITTDETYPADGDTQLKDQIIEYIGGTKSDGEAVIGLNLGEDVIYNRVGDFVYNVPGIVDYSLTIGISDNPVGTSNIAIDFNEVAKTSIANIDIV